MKIECTESEHMLLKRNIHACDCKPLACVYASKCDKPPEMTCGQYILSLIEWEVTE